MKEADCRKAVRAKLGPDEQKPDSRPPQRVTQQRMGKPDSQSERCGGKSGGGRGKRHDLPWEVSASVWTNQTTGLATGWEGAEKSAEAIVGGGSR